MQTHHSVLFLTIPTVPSSLFPVQLQCFIPITPHLLPQVTWREVRAVFCMKTLIWMLMEAMPVTQSPPYIGGNTMLVVSRTDNATLIIVTYNCVHIYSLVFTQCHYALELSCFCSYVSAFNPVLKSVFAGVVIHDYIIMDDPNSNCIPHCYT